MQVKDFFDLDKQEIAKKLGSMIREVRERKKISINEIHRRTDIAQSHLSNIELGKKYVRVDTLIKIIKAIDDDLDLYF